MRAPSGCLHYPVIRTEKIEGPLFQKAVEQWPRFTHVVFTSQEAVRFWDRDLAGKQVVAVGEATARAVREYGAEPLIARVSTQEGVVALLETIDLSNAYVLFPHSKKARHLLLDWLKTKHSFCFSLYDTHFQKPGPIPDLNEIDEIVFTSPSTVDGFLQIFGALPKDKKLKAIGPVTEEKLALVKKLSDRYDLSYN